MRCSFPFCLWAGLTVLATTLAAGERDFPAVTPEQARALAAEQSESWRARLPATGSRLFYLETEWPALTARINSLADDRARWKNELFAAADKIVAAPTVAYEPPEKKVSSKTTLHEALEELWERPVGDSMVALALAARLSGDDKYKTKLHDVVLAACKYETWGRNSHPNMDLAAAHIARGIAVAYDWERPIFTREEQQLIRDTIRERVGAELRGLYGEIYWSTGYMENHNHVNAAAIGLCGLAFLGEIPEANEWLAAALLDFQNVTQYGNADGSSAEGVPYWSYGASFIVQFIEGTRKVTGSDSLYNQPFLKNAASYRIGSATPGWDGIVPWGDAPNRDFYGPQHLLYLFASQYKDAAAQYAANAIPFPPSGGADVAAWTLLWCNPELPVKAPDALDYHATVLDMLTTRSGWGASDYLLSLKSGFSNRNHSHLDIGALIFAWGDDWLLMTSGYGRGHGEAGFWDRIKGARWDFLSNATESQSTLVIDGRNQRSDPSARGTTTHFLSSPTQCWSRVDLTGVYDGVQAADRTLFHRRGDYFLVLDSVRAEKKVRVEWLAQVVPRTKHEPGRLTAWGNSGRLAITLLDGADDFAPRAPLSPKPDLPAERQRTYAAAAEGKNPRFAVLLQPLPDTSSTPLTAVFTNGANGAATVQVNGTGWKDVILREGSNAPLPAKNFGVSTAKVSPSVSASVAAFREQDGNLVSFSALELAALKLSSLELIPSTPVDMVLETGTAPGSVKWILSTPFNGRIALQPGGRLLDAAGKAVTPDATVSLAPGEYLFAF